MKISLHPKHSLKRSNKLHQSNRKTSRNQWRNRRAKSRPNQLVKNLQPKREKRITLHRQRSIKPRKSRQLLLRTAQTRQPKTRILPKTALILVLILQTLKRTKLNNLLYLLARRLAGSPKPCSIKRKDPSMCQLSLILTIKTPKMMTQCRKSPNKRAIIDTLKIIILTTKETNNRKVILTDSNRIRIRQGSLLKQRKRVKRLIRRKPRLRLKQKLCLRKKRLKKQLRRLSKAKSKRQRLRRAKRRQKRKLKRLL